MALAQERATQKKGLLLIWRIRFCLRKESSMVSGSAWLSVTWGRENLGNLKIQSLLSTSYLVPYCLFKVAATSWTVSFIYSVSSVSLLIAPQLSQHVFGVHPGEWEGRLPAPLGRRQGPCCCLCLQAEQQYRGPSFLESLVGVLESANGQWHWHLGCYFWAILEVKVRWVW